MIKRGGLLDGDWLKFATLADVLLRSADSNQTVENALQWANGTFGFCFRQLLLVGLRRLTNAGALQNIAKNFQSNTVFHLVEPIDGCCHSSGCDLGGSDQSARWFYTRFREPDCGPVAVRWFSMPNRPAEVRLSKKPTPWMEKHLTEVWVGLRVQHTTGQSLKTRAVRSLLLLDELAVTARSWRLCVMLLCILSQNLQTVVCVSLEREFVCVCYMAR